MVCNALVEYASPRPALMSVNMQGKGHPKWRLYPTLWTASTKVVKIIVCLMQCEASLGLESTLGFAYAAVMVEVHPARFTTERALLTCRRNKCVGTVACPLAYG